MDNTTELWMTKYIIGETFNYGGATLYKNPFDQTVYSIYLKNLFFQVQKKQKGCFHRNGATFDSR